MRQPPERVQRLPEQYFTALLARVAAAAAEEGEQLVDLGRGNPEVGPPEHVIRALAGSAARPDVHGYAPFAGLPALKEAIAARYRDVYRVELDPAREVAVLPGTKTGLMEFALCAVEHGGTIVLPDPGYPDYFSAVALAGARVVSFDGFDTRGDALYLNFPSNPTAAAAPDGIFDGAVEWARRNDAWVLHDFAYGDLVFDGRAPRSFVAADGARDVGIELFSMSKSYGMAGWRLGFALGSGELVRRIENLQDHAFAGIFRPVQEAGIAALTGPQDSVEERRATYERRRDGRALARRTPRGGRARRGLRAARRRLGAALARRQRRDARPRARTTTSRAGLTRETLGDVADDLRELLRAGPHRPVAGRQVDPFDAPQLAETAEPRLSFCDRVLVLRRRVPRRDRRRRDVQPSVVLEVRAFTQNAAGLRHGAAAERRELLLAQAVEVLAELVPRRERELGVRKARVERCGRRAGVDVDHRRDPLRQAVARGVARSPGAAVHGEHDGTLRGRERAADRVDVIAEGHV